jgi:hypothetical protein
MGWLVEVQQAVEDYRLELGLEGAPVPQDAWDLAAMLELEVRRVDGLPAHLCIEKRRIILPVGLDRREEALILLEELGHWLFRGHAYHGNDVRGYLLGDGKHETAGTAFALLWTFARAYGQDHEIAAERDCPAEWVTRYQQLLLRAA